MKFLYLHSAASCGPNFYFYKQCNCACKNTWSLVFQKRLSFSSVQSSNLELKHAASTSPYDYCIDQNFRRLSQDVLNECMHFMNTTFEVFEVLLLATCVSVIKETLKSTKFFSLITKLPFHNTNSTALAMSKNAQKTIKLALRSRTNSL